MQNHATLIATATVAAALIVGFPASADAASPESVTKTAVFSGLTISISETIATPPDPQHPDSQRPSSEEAPPAPDAPGAPVSGSPDSPAEVPEFAGSSLLPPENLSALTSTDGLITLMWAKPPNGLGVAYQVERSHGGPFELLGTTTEAGFCDLDVLADIDHFYRVFTVDADGARSNEAALILVEAPPLTPPPLEDPAVRPQPLVGERG